MRIIKKDKIVEAVKNLCIKSNFEIDKDVERLLEKAYKEENDILPKEVIRDILKNCSIAKAKKIPMCQDTGLTVVFVKKGEGIQVEGGLEEAIREGVRKGYREGYFRKSIVDPLTRKNTEDNTPATIHTSLAKGDGLKITVVPRGFGSENMGKASMLDIGNCVKEVKKFVLDSVKESGGNSCPPVVIGIGIGGTLEKAALLAKEALINDSEDGRKNVTVKKLEKDLLKEINKLNIGPGGLGGKTTALRVTIKTYPTHIAGLPVAINIGCWCHRVQTIVL
ncbi:MAG: fumarate hydratase [bacterium]|nr:fumarate hydratase [bacterium]